MDKNNPDSQNPTLSQKQAAAALPLNSQVEHSSDFVNLKKKSKKDKKDELSILGKFSAGQRAKERHAKNLPGTSSSGTRLIHQELSHFEKPNRHGTLDTLVTTNLVNDGGSFQIEFKDVRPKEKGNSCYPLPSPIVPPASTPRKNTVKWSANSLSDLQSYQESESNIKPSLESGELSETRSKSSTNSSTQFKSFSTNTIEELTNKLNCHSKSFDLPKNKQVMAESMDESEKQSSSANASAGREQWESEAALAKAAGMPEGILKYESYKRIFKSELEACKNKCSISFKNMQILKAGSSRDPKTLTSKTYANPKAALEDDASAEDIIECFFKELNSVSLVNQLKDLGKFDDNLRTV